MKKKLEADLISIAHRILKIKNKSDVNQLYLETQKLYEKLAVLKFVQENFDETKPTIGLASMDSQIEEAFLNETIVVHAPVAEKSEVIETSVSEQAPIANQEAIRMEEIVLEETISEVNENPEHQIAEEVLSEEIISEEIVAEETLPLVSLKEEEKEEIFVAEEDKTMAFISETTFNESIPNPEIKEEEEKIEEKEKIEEIEEKEEKEEIKTTSKPEAIQISFEDLMGINYTETQFVKVDDMQFTAPAKSIEFEERKKEPEVAVLEKTPPKALSLNDRLAKSIHIDLNDRLAFTKHLFGNNPEDYNRVLNQLITFDTFGETKQFIEEMVKPDYNNWNGKEDYENRFMEILEKKFL